MSDFQIMKATPSGVVNTRGSIEPPLSLWQMNGWGAARYGPDGELEVASPMQCIAGLVPATPAEK